MRSKAPFYLSVVAAVTMLMSPVSGHAVFSIFSPYQKVKELNGEVKIPVGEVSDDEAHYYVFKQNGSSIKFFVVKSQDGVIRAAFDACDVCFPAKKGYTKQGDFMICNNCGRKFHTNRINVEQGGCNPAPLTRQLAGDTLVIKVADILSGSRFF